MKRITAILLMLVMLLTLMTACGDSDSPTIDASDKQSSHLLDKYIKINKTGKYIINFQYQLDNDTVVPVTFTISGTDKKLITFKFTKEALGTSEDLPFSILINGDNKYMVFSSKSGYATLTDEDLAISSLQTLIKSSYLSLTSLAYKTEGTTTVDNIKYSYEDYMNPSSNIVIRFLFNSKDELVMNSMVENGVVSTYNKIEILSGVTDDMFEIPKDYLKDNETQKTADNIIELFKKSVTAS